MCSNLAACNPATGPCSGSPAAYDTCTAQAAGCGCEGFSAPGGCFTLLTDDPEKHAAVALCGLDGGFEQRYNAIAPYMCGP
jgi:hypothetical protein